MKKTIALIALASVVFSMISVLSPKAMGSASLSDSTSNALTLAIIADPEYGSNSALSPQARAVNQWWAVDYWSDQSGGHLPSKMNGSFVAVSNTINGLASGDSVHYLPLNVAYGTSNANCVWFRFDVICNSDGTISWLIWDIRGPGTSQSDYHSTTIGLSYVPGHGYSFALTTSGTSTVTFSIKDTTTGASWSKSNWAWTVPSLNLRYDTSLFSPASVIQGSTTSNQLTNVPYFQTTVGYGTTTYWFAWYGSSIPSCISAFVNAGPSSYYYWAMDSGNYVASIYSYGTSGAGTVTNPNNLVGIANDGQYTVLYGGNYGDGGWIIGNMNTAATGHVYVYGYSSSTYYTHLIVSVSYDGSSWITISSQTVNPGSTPYYIDCGSTASVFMYVKLNATDDNYYSARLVADAVHVIRPAEYYVSSINSYGTSGAGSVSNPNNMIGSVNDGQYTTLYGGNLGDGGWIIGNLNTAATGHVYIYGYSNAGYYTHLIVSVSSDGSSWVTLLNQTINPTASPYYIDCGLTVSTFNYIKLNAIDDNYYSAYLKVDSIHVIRREYYVSSINSYGTSGAGNVANPNNLIGSVNDGQYTVLYGGNYGDGGWIIANINTASTGHVYVYGYSYPGYYTHLIVSVSYDGTTWTTISSQTVYPTSSPYNIDCGSTSITFRYIKLNAIDDYGLSARLVADAVHVVGSNRYAVLIAGGWNAANNWARYYNDLMFMYDCLTTRYGYTADTTYVLYADGQQPTANNCPDPTHAVTHVNVIDRSATPANVQWAFSQVAARSISDDFVFVFTTDHGSNTPTGHTYLCLWGAQQVSENDFAGPNYLGAVRAYYREVITMEQCYSGGFIAPLANTKRTISTACMATEVSWACDTEGFYDEFVYHWISAVNWANPGGQAVNADTNGDGRISMTEAFLYAVSHDSQTETPQWSDLGNTGSGIFLNQW
jgi:hypothetical protein